MTHVVPHHFSFDLISIYTCTHFIPTAYNLLHSIIILSVAHISHLVVNMCTTELAKLREKCQALFSSPSPNSSAHTNTVTTAATPVQVSQVSVLKEQPPPPLCSEAAVSMIVECFSPQNLKILLEFKKLYFSMYYKMFHVCLCVY